MLIEIERSHLEDKKDAHWAVENSPLSPKSGRLKPQPKKIEVPMTDRMISFRNQLYIEPFDVFDPHKPNRGLKIFHENFRPYR